MYSLIIILKCEVSQVFAQVLCKFKPFSYNIRFANAFLSVFFIFLYFIHYQYNSYVYLCFIYA